VNKVSASAGKTIVTQGEVAKLMLKTDTAIVKKAIANSKIAMLPKRMINFMNWETGSKESQLDLNLREYTRNKFVKNINSV